MVRSVCFLSSLAVLESGCNGIARANNAFATGFGNQIVQKLVRILLQQSKFISHPVRAYASPRSTINFSFLYLLVIMCVLFFWIKNRERGSCCKRNELYFDISVSLAGKRPLCAVKLSH